ncbi:nuclear speckle splicing regulatory protein 1 [Ochlerotatus camptorhynchus]|uniref:nuclear speckle splicing regulatory protein 1 n=1 Tax=Ochlerotatus camptorhynchus TaxID=644619 RepID=UPI0031D61B01
MSKQYGLIDPKANKTKITKHAAFESDSDSESSDPKKSVNLELGESQKRQVKAVQAKVLAEDPTIYQYDELYDDMDNKRKESKADKSKEERKPKYIGKLLETADKRKKEQERRIERQVQKEREEEGEMYKDKESFVTSAYRAKLEEMKKAEEDEKREEYLENIGDVTKQSDLGGFYRHIYSQKMREGSNQKQIVNENAAREQGNSSASDEESKQEDRKRKDDSESDEEERARLEALKSKEAGQSKGRRYRKRRSDDEENDENEKNDSSKKVHLQSNLDADSDFSIDSNSSSESDSEHDNDKKRKHRKKSIEESPEKKVKTEDHKGPTNGVDNVEKSTQANGKEITKVEDNRSMKETKKKEPKIDIWKKRTVGGVFDAALHKYYERKATRESG